MTFAARENSIDGGNPVFLYRFTRNSVSYQFCSFDQDVPAPTGLTGVFARSSMTHGNIDIGGKVKETSLAIEIEIEEPLAIELLANTEYNSGTVVTVWKMHLDDPDEEYLEEYSGYVTYVELASASVLKLICVDSHAAFLEPSQGQFITLACDRFHYEFGCFLDVEDYKTACTVTAISGKVLTITEAGSEAAGVLALGRFIYNGYTVSIRKHSGTQVTVKNVPPGLETAVGGGPTAAEYARGCDRSFSTCKSLGNELNYGGYPSYVEENVFKNRSLV